MKDLEEIWWGGELFEMGRGAEGILWRGLLNGFIKKTAFSKELAKGLAMAAITLRGLPV